MNTLALCIPAYNAEAHLPRLLNSAKSQLIPFDEILVYDDCSTDATATVAEQYGAKVITGDINRGCSYGKNVLAGITLCNWIHFHDADDDLLPNFTTEVNNWINRFGEIYDILILNFNYIDYNTGDILGNANHNITELRQDPLKYAITHKIVNFGVYKKKAFLDAGGFDVDEQVLYNEDNALHQRLAKHLLKFDYLPCITCINYRYTFSMSASNRLKCERSNYHVLVTTAATHGNIYPFEIAAQLWICATMLASVQDWVYVKKALLLRNKLVFNTSYRSTKHFKTSILINPYFFIWVREKMIRLFKPHLRKNG